MSTTIRAIATSFLITLGTSLFAQDKIVIRDHIVYLYNLNYSFASRTGSDGVKVSYPNPGWRTIEGNDGRIVAYPNAGWTTSTGRDGRIIAYPSDGWTTSFGSDGRKVAFPNSGWTTSIGRDGRKIAFPSAGWITSTGRDGRLIAYPAAGWTTTIRSDGRKIAFPNSGWSTSNGTTGKLVAYPKSGWGTNSLSGRSRTFNPKKQRSVITGIHRSRGTYESNWMIANLSQNKHAELKKIDNGIAILFRNVEMAAKLEKIILASGQEAAFNYALYLLINSAYDG